MKRQVSEKKMKCAIRKKAWDSQPSKGERTKMRHRLKPSKDAYLL
jgi:hypothetical protein